MRRDERVKAPSGGREGKKIPWRKGRRSLAEAFPAVAAEWHPTKNKGIGPSDVPENSYLKVWWKCPGGPDHVWQNLVFRRTVATPQLGCPYCSNHRVSVTNQLARLYPELAAEWHPSLNGDLGPEDVTIGYSKKVFWRCSADPAHIWNAAVRARTIYGHGCPTCGRREGAKKRPPRKGPSKEKSLAAKSPAVAALWHPTKNGSLRPDQVAPTSQKEAYWRCPADRAHVWQNKIVYQFRHNKPCPLCKQAEWQASMSLEARAPDIARDWLPDRNGGRTAAEVSAASEERGYWLCRVDPSHIYPATIVSRVTNGTGCTICRLRKPQRGSLLERFPDVASEWHPTKNGVLTPKDIGATSSRRVWWKCPAAPDHEWQASISLRTVHPSPTGCPFCAGKKPSSTNSLELMFPEIAAEWHPTKNGTLKPGDMTIGSGRSVVWRCLKNPRHVWSTSPHARCVMNTGCPRCWQERRAAASRKR